MFRLKRRRRIEKPHPPVANGEGEGIADADLSKGPDAISKTKLDEVSYKELHVEKRQLFQWQYELRKWKLLLVGGVLTLSPMVWEKELSKYLPLSIPLIAVFCDSFIRGIELRIAGITSKFVAVGDSYESYLRSPYMKNLYICLLDDMATLGLSIAASIMVVLIGIWQYFQNHNELGFIYIGAGVFGVVASTWIQWRYAHQYRKIFSQENPVFLTENPLA